MELNPAQFRLLLAGPKVSRLLPFVQARGYVADAAVTGQDALELMRQAARHVLLVELELEDVLLPDLLTVVRRENLAGAVILLEDPARSGQIVSALVRGVDGYVATPPDELYLFRLIERQLLAQWALAQAQRSTLEQQEKTRLEKAVQHERQKVTELVREIASLREEVRAAKAAAKTKMRPPMSAEEFDDLDDAVTEQAAISVAANMRSSARTSPGEPLADDRTSPRGWQPPPDLRQPAADVGFDDSPPTRPGLTIEEEEEARAAARAVLADEEDDDELFLDLDDPTAGHEQTGKGKRDDDAFLIDED